MITYGLLGHKLSHSISPLVHSVILRYAGLNGRYEIFEREKDEISDLLDEIILTNIQGINVTIPYKETVFSMVSTVNAEAREIGAINTICLKEHKLSGYNTDCYGFIKMLECNDISVMGKSIAVLGSGGSSKAVCYALNSLGAKHIYVVSRNPINSTSSYDKISYDELNDVHYDIIVNTTPVGMYPNVDDSPIGEDMVNRADAVVDIVYRPQMTKLLSFAHKHSKKYANGLYMLTAQAIKAQSIWNDISFTNEDIKKIYKEVRGGYDFG